jgi:hypothetical protein
MLEICLKIGYNGISDTAEGFLRYYQKTDFAGTLNRNILFWGNRGNVLTHDYSKTMTKISD